ncbi:MAG: 2-amino-4-hydroxy-6-hydroxymethyldihydropteridine diphosphokinase [Elainellaceae cyanobacterium]
MIHPDGLCPPRSIEFRHRAAIALGGNLGHPKTTLESALEAIAHTPGVVLGAHSRFYETVAVGPPQPNFLNACALVSTDLTARELLHVLLDIEAQFGRIRRERWGPRSLDLDLLLFDDQIVRLPHLQVPHPRMNERAFVLVPLADVAPDWIDPISGLAIAQLLEAVDCSGVVGADILD